MKTLLTSLALLLGLSTAAALPAQAESYTGIGITIQIKNNMTQIIGVLAGGPAARAGIEPGVFIRAVDTRKIDGKTLEEVAELVRGPQGTTVTLTLSDEKGEGVHDVALQREVLDIKCLIEGQVNLTYYGDGTTGTIYGNLGDEPVSWNVSLSRASGYVKNHYVTLDLEKSINDWRLHGWINSTYVSWYSSGGRFFTWQTCVPNKGPN
jgi:hypothetical protein